MNKRFDPGVVTFSINPRPVTTGVVSSPCTYCDGHHSGVCPRVESIEYYANGAVKKVTLRRRMI